VSVSKSQDDPTVSPTLDPAQAILTTISGVLSSAGSPELDRPELAPYAASLEQILNQIHSLRSIDDNNLVQDIVHNIKSPLSALLVLLRNMDSVPPDLQKIAQLAVSRIQQITDRLAKRHATRRRPSEAPETHPTLLWVSVDEVLSEKRVQYGGHSQITIDSEYSSRSLTRFAVLDETELQATLSNLIDNAVESLVDKKGLVKVRMYADDANTFIEIIDSGPGLPKEILSRLGERGATFGKVNGSGIGIAHAHAFAREAHGEIQFESSDAGTLVRLSLPLAPTPTWFAINVDLLPEESLLVLDDQPTMHALWLSRLRQNPDLRKNEAHFIASKEELDLFLTNHLSEPHPSQNAVLIIDLDLGHGVEHGLELLCELLNRNLFRQIYLSTSHWKSHAVQAICLDRDLKMIPKTNIHQINIRLDDGSPTSGSDIVLIDDDPLVHQCWQLQGALSNKNVLCFPTAQEFLSSRPAMDRRTPIYVDLNLAKHSGEDDALLLYKKGFSHIIMATGSLVAQTKMKPWIKAVQGKDFPLGL
jgi:hypothetical protein